jgi:hypothetical protein
MRLSDLLRAIVSEGAAGLLALAAAPAVTAER